MLDKLTYDSFAPYLHQTFLIRDPEVDPIEIELTDITKLQGGTGRADVDTKRAPFSIIFVGPSSETALPQAIYTLEHPELGALEIFLVPIGPDEHGMRYEAVFA